MFTFEQQNYLFYTLHPPPTKEKFCTNEIIYTFTGIEMQVRMGVI